MRSACSGFTLIEVLVVLAVVSLVTMLTMPLVRRVPVQAQLKAEATRLASSLRVTRAAAMAQNREMVFRVDGIEHIYDSDVVAASVIDPRIEVGLNIPASANPLARGGIRFYPSGRSSGGEILLKTDTLAMRVSVIWATGRVALGK